MNLSELFTFSLYEWLSLILTISAFIVTAVYHLIPWVKKRTCYKNANFELYILDQFPPNHHRLGGLVSFPLGTFDLYVMVQSKEVFPLQRVNFRFLDKREPPKGFPYGDVNGGIIALSSMKYWDNQYVNIQSFSDQAGGVEAELTRTLKKRDGLYFQLRIHSQQPWVGLLSFRAIDSDGHESFARNKLIAFGLSYEDAVQVWTGHKMISDGQNLYHSATTESLALKIESQNELIPLQEAAKKLYTELRRSESLWAKAAEQMSGRGSSYGSPEDILDYMAILISQGKPIYGKRLPSTAVEVITRDELQLCVFAGGALRLDSLLPGTATQYTDLAVKAEDLGEVIAEKQFQSGFLED